MRERRDKTFYDTNCIEAGQTVKFFGARNLGLPFRTNMLISEQISESGTFIIYVMGCRLLGKTREQEDVLMDHLHVNLVIGDKPYYDALGPQLSMLRHVFLRSELERLERESRIFNNESEWTKTGKDGWEPPSLRLGYHFGSPIIVPTRQLFRVDVSASDQMPEAVDMRVHLFGLETRPSL